MDAPCNQTKWTDCGLTRMSPLKNPFDLTMTRHSERSATLRRSAPVAASPFGVSHGCACVLDNPGRQDPLHGLRPWTNRATDRGPNPNPNSSLKGGGQNRNHLELSPKAAWSNRMVLTVNLEQSTSLGASEQKRLTEAEWWTWLKKLQKRHQKQNYAIYNDVCIYNNYIYIQYIPETS